jgi:hypothetical protein
MAPAWLGVFVYLPILSIREAGSVRAWLRECLREPIASLAGLLIALGCCAFLLWMLTGGAVPVRLAPIAPAGFLVAILHQRSRRPKQK